MLAECIRVILIAVAVECLLQVSTYGQEVPIEDRVPANVAENPVIANMIDRLRILRVNESKLGEKHPSRKKIRVQIEELEKQLAERVAMEAPPPVRSPFRESSQPEKSPSAPKADPSKVEKSIVKRLSRGVWGANVVVPKFSSTGSATLKLAFPNLKTVPLDLVGAFPALGLMWGIENDEGSGMTRIWQWHDHPDSSTQVLYWESAGRLAGLQFADDFEKSGSVYLLLSTQSGDGIDDIRALEVIRLTLDRLPPFGVLADSKVVLATGQYSSRNPVCLLSHQDGTLGMFVGNHGAVRSVDERCFVVKRGNGYWLIDPSPRSTDSKSEMPSRGAGDVDLSCPIAWDRKTTIYVKQQENHWVASILHGKEDVSQKTNDSVLFFNPVFGSIVRSGRNSERAGSAVLGDEATGMIWSLPLTEKAVGEPTLRCRVSSRLKSIGIDSNGYPVVVLQDGLFRFEELLEKDRISESDIPRSLSDTNWFETLPSQANSPGFLEYAIAEPNFTDGLISRRWIGMPGESSVDVSRPTNWRFPNRTIALKTIFKAHEWTEEGDQLPIETRALVKRDGQWYGLRYLWNPEGKDASLVTEEQSGSPAADWKVVIDERRCGDRNTSNCNVCHCQSTNDYLLGFNTKSLDIELKGFVNKSQLEALLDGKVLAQP
ncbi:MAG: hypothetical protein FJ308_15955, partial [Planctomycetes bacterium]|nr:hypothetical protein [Planctomycetota bacterium]